MSVEDIVGAEMAGRLKPAGNKKSEEEPSGDALYTFDEQKLKELRSTTPWMKDPRHFQTVKLSPSAIMKMSMHCQSGVEKGIAKGGNPVEVMGLLIGRPLETKPGTLVVTDAFPLPIEGFETRVVADDQDVVNVRFLLARISLLSFSHVRYSNDASHST
jgi:COP9 signalosome complex subunit 5